MGADEVIDCAWSELRVGHRVRWIMPAFVKRGTITFIQKRSMKVWFDGDDRETTIPDAKEYFVMAKQGRTDYALARLAQDRVFILKSPDTVREELVGQVVQKMDVAAVAAYLGTNPKEVRRKLRQGKIKGYRENGHWYVNREDLK